LVKFARDALGAFVRAGTDEALDRDAHHRAWRASSRREPDVLREALFRTRTGDPLLTMEVLYQLS
jgi:hypothetical protein